MNKTTPEQAGISSENIMKFIKALEDAELSTHSLILSRGGNIFYENYWAPFSPAFLHRMYSVTKSFVSLAIGFLEQDGLISLDDPISKYFSAELNNQTDENLKNQTIRHMLMMSTAKSGRDWFAARTDDRVRFYFENDISETRPSGTIFQYDSTGSFILGALAERITKMPLMDYLRLKLFDKIGVSKEAYCLTCPGGHSWSDSALLCTPLDLLKVAEFVMNRGRWNGEQILNEDYIVAATSKQIDNNITGVNEYETQGYGYQFWCSYEDSFLFNGMGCQFAFCVPGKNIIMIYNADNQGKPFAKKIIFENFFKYIVHKAADSSLPESAEKLSALLKYSKTLHLASAKGRAHSDFENEINNVTFKLSPNDMGITKCRLCFEKNQGRFEYTNAQGDKTIYFGMCENVFEKFPQTGYSDNTGSVRVPGHQYNCAASAAWIEDKKLFIKVQIIDKYFGTLNINLGFADDKIGIYMNKSAEDFLNEYQGFAGGIRC